MTEEFSSQSHISTSIIVPQSRMVDLARIVDPSICADAVLDACCMDYATGGVRVTVTHTQQPIKAIPEIGLKPVSNLLSEGSE
jgi:hypothetical protein